MVRTQLTIPQDLLPSEKIAAASARLGCPCGRCWSFDAPEQARIWLLDSETLIVDQALPDEPTVVWELCVVPSGQKMDAGWRPIYLLQFGRRAYRYHLKKLVP